MQRSAIIAALCVSTVFAQAPNGTCAAAQPVAAGTTFSSNAGEPDALDGGTAPSCRTAAVKDVWFTFAATVTGNHQIFTCQNPGDPAPSNTDTVLQVLSGPCGAFTQVACDDDGCALPGLNSTLFATLTGGTTYFIRVCSWSPTDPSGTFGLTIVEPTPPPANDSCASPISLALGANGPFTNVGAALANDPGFSTPTMTGCPFGNVGGADVFFTYTSDCDATVTVSSCGGNGTIEPGELADSQISVYDAWTCGSPNTAVACNDDAGGTTCGVNGFQSTVSFAVTAGSTYLIRVAGFGAVQGAFSLNVSRSTAQLVAIGSGCGAGPAPTLSGSGLPQFDTTGTLTVQAQPAAFGALLASPPNTAMAYAPFGPCTIYLLQPGLVFLLPIGTDLAGQWTLATSFGSYDPVLDCLGIDLQAIVIGPAGIEFTNALRLVIGT